jgi:hypothetical protein
MTSRQVRDTQALRQPLVTSRHRARAQGALTIQKNGIFAGTPQFSSVKSWLPE